MAKFSATFIVLIETDQKDICPGLYQIIELLRSRGYKIAEPVQNQTLPVLEL